MNKAVRLYPYKPIVLLIRSTVGYWHDTVVCPLPVRLYNGVTPLYRVTDGQADGRTDGRCALCTGAQDRCRGLDVVPSCS